MNKKHFLLAIAPHNTDSPLHSSALELAQQTQSRVTLTTVVDSLQQTPGVRDDNYSPYLLLSYVKEKMQDQLLFTLYELQKKFPNIEFNTQVLSGSPYRELIKYSREAAVDYIITRHKRLPGSKIIHFGSTTKHLMRKSSVPVWAESEQGPAKIKHLIVAIDLGFGKDKNSINELSEKLVQKSIQISKLMNGTTTVLHAWKLVGKDHLEFWERRDDEYITSLSEKERRVHLKKAEELIAPYVTPHVELVLIEGGSRNVIIDQIKQQKPDLLVMGSVGRSGIPGLLIGNTAESVIDSVDCNVLTFKPEDFVSPFDQVSIENEDE